MRKGATPQSRARGTDHTVLLLDDRSGEKFAAPERFAGYALQDPLGREVGRVEKLFLNGRGVPEYVAVRIGGLWGRKSVLIPVESARVNDGDRVLVLG